MMFMNYVPSQREIWVCLFHGSDVPGGSQGELQFGLPNVETLALTGKKVYHPLGLAVEKMMGLVWSAIGENDIFTGVHVSAYRATTAGEGPKPFTWIVSKVAYKFTVDQLVS